MHVIILFAVNSHAAGHLQPDLVAADGGMPTATTGIVIFIPMAYGYQLSTILVINVVGILKGAVEAKAPIECVCSIKNSINRNKINEN